MEGIEGKNKSEKESPKAKDKNLSDILDKIEDCKNKLSFLTIAITRILASDNHCQNTICGLQSLMFPLEDDLDKISSELNEIFNNRPGEDVCNKASKRRQP